MYHRELICVHYACPCLHPSPVTSVLSYLSQSTTVGDSVYLCSLCRFRFWKLVFNLHRIIMWHQRSFFIEISQELRQVRNALLLSLKWSETNFTSPFPEIHSFTYKYSLIFYIFTFYTCKLLFNTSIPPCSLIVQNFFTLNFNVLLAIAKD